MSESPMLNPPVQQSIAAPRCPAYGCGGEMTPHPMPVLDGSGLRVWRCSACRHQGFRAEEGLRLLFGGRHEHVCTYGPSALTLTVIFSGAALVLFRERGLSPSQAALYTAQWALLNGQVTGTLQMFLESAMLARSYEYINTYLLPTVEGMPETPLCEVSDRVQPVGHMH